MLSTSAFKFNLRRYGAEVEALWHEYEAGETEEAKMVKVRELLVVVKVVMVSSFRVGSPLLHASPRHRPSSTHKSQSPDHQQFFQSQAPRTCTPLY
jgi:hypothetical protein